MFFKSHQPILICIDTRIEILLKDTKYNQPKMFTLIISILLISTCNALTVHIVPHTHDDVGWLKTVDEYYSGANNTIQHAAVRNIISAVVTSLHKNPERKFTYVEQAFFQRVSLI